MARVLLVAALLAAPATAYVASPGASSLPQETGLAAAPARFEPMMLELEEPAAEAQSTGAFGVLAAGFGVGAVLGWLNSRKQQVASVAAATAMAMTPVAANAMVDYEGVEYLGGSDKVDINNANVQAYRQFPGMFPTVAGVIGTHGPYKSVSDLYNIPGLADNVKAVIQKYEGNLVCLPANPAYFIDRINNGLYR